MLTNLITKNATAPTYGGHRSIPSKHLIGANGANHAQLSLHERQKPPVTKVPGGENSVILIADEQRITSRGGQVKVTASIPSHIIFDIKNASSFPAGGHPDCSGANDIILLLIDFILHNRPPRVVENDEHTAGEASQCVPDTAP
ncbi:rh45 [macacine betaherpesvirus 3]|uniref:Rh45 n=1 Tax=Rhesus cytomegalovirus (strain 68-1) TaxID=47929 RepID=Q7TFT6_RHCM6|nr:rh45 [macacine betaherpesvirus 3]AAP50572.1 rh45 [macacine betaherpesvirus 3]AAZ80542.1 rh45 [macacine betaherpesvirus 3]